MKKRSGAYCLLFFLLAAVVTAGSYFLYVDAIGNTKKPADAKKSANQHTRHNLSEYDANKKKKFVQDSLMPSLSNQAVQKENHDSDSKSSVTANLKKYNDYQNRSVTPQNRKTDFSEINKTLVKTQPSIKKNYSPSVSNTFNYKTIINSDSTKENTLIQNSGNGDSVIKTSLIKNDKTFDTVSSAKNKSQQRINKKSGRWSWGITAMVGRSNIVNSFDLSNFQFAKSNNLDAFPGDTTSAFNTNKPYWTATAYDFGVLTKRKILKNSYINFGLQYLHLSTKSYTAISLNNSLIPVAASSYNLTTPGNYYIPGTKKTYTNKYNFIELPVFFQSNLLHKKQFSILYDAGASVMQLINKNSLLYNSNDKSFFTDSTNLLRRTQFQLSAGLDFQLHTRHSGNFIIGPAIKYSLSGFLKNNDYKKLHYMHFGLNAAWLFNKK